MALLRLPGRRPGDLLPPPQRGRRGPPRVDRATRAGTRPQTKADARIGWSAALDPQRDTVVVVSTMAVDAGGHGGQTRSSSRSRSSFRSRHPPRQLRRPRPGRRRADCRPRCSGTNLPAVNQGHPLVDLLPALGISPCRDGPASSVARRYAARSERPCPRSRRSQIRYRHTEHCPTVSALTKERCAWGSCGRSGGPPRPVARQVAAAPAMVRGGRGRLRPHLPSAVCRPAGPDLLLSFRC